MFATVQVPESVEDKDTRLISEWKAAIGFDKDQKLERLLQAMAGAIHQAAAQYFGAPVPQRILELEAKRMAVEALADWQPGMGTKPVSFVQTRVRQRLYRYVAEHQNIGRMPEAQVRQIGDFRQAIGDLTHKFKREPSASELADHLGLPVAHIARLRKSLRPDILSTAAQMEDMESFADDAGYQKAMMAYYNLNEQEKSVFDYLLGAHGQTRMTPGDIATKLKLSPARISAIKESIAKKLGPFL